jgi:hypothetical protein
MSKASAAIESKRELYEKAKAATPKNADGSVNETAVIESLAAIIDFDENVARLRIAKTIINDLCKASPEPYGQLSFPGVGTWGWEPTRLIRSEGKLIENAKATLPYKLDDAQRSSDHAADSQASARRKQYESTVFTKWATAEMEKGRRMDELTWGECVEAIGVYDPLGSNDASEAQP